VNVGEVALAMVQTTHRVSGQHPGCRSNPKGNRSIKSCGLVRREGHSYGTRTKKVSFPTELARIPASQGLPVLDLYESSASAMYAPVKTTQVDYPGIASSPYVGYSHRRITVKREHGDTFHF